MKRIIGVAGHRPTKAGYDTPKLNMFAQLTMQKADPDIVVTGMAVGWDQAVAEACVALRIPFVAAVPFEGQEGRWPQAVQDRYWELLGLAQKVVHTGKPGYSEEKMRTRNKWIGQQSTRAIVLYDGLGDSGTAHFVRHAENLGLPLLNVWTDWLLYRQETP